MNKINSSIWDGGTAEKRAPDCTEVGMRASLKRHHFK